MGEGALIQGGRLKGAPAPRSAPALLEIYGRNFDEDLPSL